MKNLFLKYWPCLLLLFLGACKTNTTDDKKMTGDTDFPYKINSPSSTFPLPKQLKEISGIAAYSKTEFACVNDEKGNIYLYNTDKKAISRVIDFGKKGDYEGLALVDNTAFVLRNNGNLYEVENFDTDSANTVKHKSFLSSHFDTEGLSYDKKNNRLLVACKAGGKGAAYLNERPIFAFDLAKKEYSEIPAYKISDKAIDEFLKKQGRQDEAIQLNIYKKQKGLDIAFNPSGIAVHPDTGNIYLISAVTRLIMAIHAETGNILHFEMLPASLFPQAEGITFDENGEMVIATEGTPGLIYCL